ncbi:iron uptake porin, partial [Prochlorococcus marinus]
TTQFSDVVPGDWAYTALQNLSESYGCVDNAYTQNLKSGQALTRYEAAALVNACLDGGIASAEVTPDAARLANEFGTEMAILKGRVDGLEYKVKELSAGQFSSSTKLSGSAVFTTGAIDGMSLFDDPYKGKTAFEYRYGIDLNTSFNGTDGLYAGIEQGNQDDLVLQDAVTDSTLTVTSLFYNFQVGEFDVTAGPLFDQDDVISATTSIASESFRLSSMPWGAVATTGAGAAIAYSNDSGFNASLSSVSSDAADASKGIWTDGGADIYTASLGYDSDYYGGGLIYTDDDTDTSFGGGIYMRPDGFPTISVAYDTKDPAASGTKSSSHLLIGVDHEVGPGTASAAYTNHDQMGVTGDSFEIYYNYPVSDGLSLQAGVFWEDRHVVKNGSWTTQDATGYLVETNFSF